MNVVPEIIDYILIPIKKAKALYKVAGGQQKFPCFPAWILTGYFVTGCFQVLYL